MNNQHRWNLGAMALILLGAVIASTACNSSQEPTTTTTPTPKTTTAAAPTFSLAWSEYPSWSAFGVADEVGVPGRIQQVDVLRLVIEVQRRAVQRMLVFLLLIGEVADGGAFVDIADMAD